MNEKLAPVKTVTLTILLLLFAYPVGLFLMWKSKTFKLSIRWLITITGLGLNIWFYTGFYTLMNFFPDS